VGASLRAVQVLQALDADQPDRVQGFYEAVVTQGVADYNARPAAVPGPGRRLVAAGLTPAYAAGADDASRDEQIRRSMAEAFAVIGQGVGTPALVVHRDPPVGLLGPVVASAPTGPDAARLWDAVLALATVPGVLELSRPRPPRPAVPGLRW
jgi:mycothiol-dependent nitroreductase-like protein